MQEDIEQLQSQLNHQVRGLIWISKESLDLKPRPYLALDYFLNGLLMKMGSSQEQPLSKNLFCTNHFGKSFFLGHLEGKSSSLDKEIVSLMSWAKTQLTDGEKVMVLDQTGKQVTKALHKKYPKLNFQDIVLN